MGYPVIFGLEGGDVGEQAIADQRLLCRQLIAFDKVGKLFQVFGAWS